VGWLDNTYTFNFNYIDSQKSLTSDINNFIEDNPREYKKLPKENQKVLNIWQEFINSIPEDVQIPSFPIWGMEFGATYPYRNTYPNKMRVKDLGKYRGSFGTKLNQMTRKEQFANLPSYARVTKKFPDWKIRWIGYNRKFYKENKRFIKQVVKEISQLPFQSWQKLEWNVGDNSRNIKNYILQFRASGIRVKKINTFPSLVTSSTQIPIIGWKYRYVTKEEGLKLQALDGLKVLPESSKATFKALGNAVNVKIVKLIANQLIIENKDSFNNKKIKVKIIKKVS
jgi:DNA (cytosine-5)-methyltransferase 1